MHIPHTPPTARVSYKTSPPLTSPPPHPPGFTPNGSAPASSPSVHAPSESALALRGSATPCTPPALKGGCSVSRLSYPPPSNPRPSNPRPSNAPALTPRRASTSAAYGNEPGCAGVSGVVGGVGLQVWVCRFRCWRVVARGGSEVGRYD